jgi:hypothetical protein
MNTTFALDGYREHIRLNREMLAPYQAAERLTGKALLSQAKTESLKNGR